jgi:riboflavin biosynthesis pyrimidine reductase
MVEGGLRLIASLVADALIDRLVVTVGPVFAGPEARGPVFEVPPRLTALRSEVFGVDTVMACVVERTDDGQA